MKVLIGLSGGVDSSTAALLLKKSGFEVIGVSMSIWGENGFAKIEKKNACYGPSEKKNIEMAKLVSKILDISYFVIDCKDNYENIVIENFKKEYLEGKTPNPCVLCNAFIKFGILPELAKKKGIIFDKFATGHYASIEKLDNNRYGIKRGIVEKKDQSYFLYRLKQEQLKNIILPLGNYSKDEIRKIAKENNIPVADKPASQDFYGRDYNELLNINEKIGNIIDKNGKIVGKHRGFWNYTIGQRKGLGVSAKEPLYVLELRDKTNEVVVGYIDETFKKSLIATNLNWVAIENLKNEKEVFTKIRSTQNLQKSIIFPLDNGEIKVVFDEFQKSIAIGQSVVFYCNDFVLGGGIIKEVL